MVKLILGQIDISSLLKAHASWMESLDKAHSLLERDGAIQRFEYSYELFWKTLRRILKFKGKICNSPRDVFREAAADGLLDNPKFWFNVIEKRNQTTHTYNEETAEMIFEELPAIAEAMKVVLETIQAL